MLLTGINIDHLKIADNYYLKSDYNEFVDNYNKILTEFNIIVEDKNITNKNDCNIDEIVKNYNNYTKTNTMTPDIYILLHTLIRVKIMNYIIQNPPFPKLIINNEFMNLLRKNGFAEILFLNPIIKKEFLYDSDSDDIKKIKKTYESLDDDISIILGKKQYYLKYIIDGLK